MSERVSSSAYSHGVTFSFAPIFRTCNSGSPFRGHGYWVEWPTVTLACENFRCLMGEYLAQTSSHLVKSEVAILIFKVQISHPTFQFQHFRFQSTSRGLYALLGDTTEHFSQVSKYFRRYSLLRPRLHTLVNQVSWPRCLGMKLSRFFRPPRWRVALGNAWVVRSFKF